MMRTRRSARQFSKEAFPIEVIKNCVSIAASAPSGANMQPWSFIIIQDPEIKSKIRRQCETIEKEFYDKQITQAWKRQLELLKTSISKPFLEYAPYLICVFIQAYSLDEKGQKVKHYYPSESVGIATGFLISAIHQLGLSCLTYTPAKMHFLNTLLHRPENERAYMIIPVGYPSDDAEYPDITRKKFDEVCVEM